MRLTGCQKRTAPKDCVNLIDKGFIPAEAKVWALPASEHELSCSAWHSAALTQFYLLKHHNVLILPILDGSYSDEFYISRSFYSDREIYSAVTFCIMNGSSRKSKHHILHSKPEWFC